MIRIITPRTRSLRFKKKKKKKEIDSFPLRATRREYSE